MDMTVKEIAKWARLELDQAVLEFGGKEQLYRHLQNNYGISKFTVRNFHKCEKNNPTQNMLDGLVAALKNISRPAA